MGGGEKSLGGARCRDLVSVVVLRFLRKECCSAEKNTWRVTSGTSTKTRRPRLRRKALLLRRVLKKKARKNKISTKQVSCKGVDGDGLRSRQRPSPKAQQPEPRRADAPGLSSRTKVFLSTPFSSPFKSSPAACWGQ